MYNKVECITLTCDNCGEQYSDENGTGFSIFVDESSANDFADNDGWSLHNEDDKHYCPECFDIDDDDNLIVRTERRPENI